jgi:hypothetical protein
VRRRAHGVTVLHDRISRRSLPDRDPGEDFPAKEPDPGAPAPSRPCHDLPHSSRPDARGHRGGKGSVPRLCGQPRHRPRLPGRRGGAGDAAGEIRAARRGHPARPRRGGAGRRPATGGSCSTRSTAWRRRGGSMRRWGLRRPRPITPIRRRGRSIWRGICDEIAGSDACRPRGRSAPQENAERAEGSPGLSDDDVCGGRIAAPSSRRCRGDATGPSQGEARVDARGRRW